MRMHEVLRLKNCWRCVRGNGKGLQLVAHQATCTEVAFWIATDKRMKRKDLPVDWEW